MSPKRRIRYYYLKFRRLRGDPTALARGSAIGAFMAVMPIMPLRTVVIISSTAFIHANTIAALIIATAIANPITLIPLYYIAFVTGNALMPFSINWERIENVLGMMAADTGFTASLQAVTALGIETIIALLLGGFVLALPVSLITYGLTLRYFRHRRRRKRLPSA